jgi:hypothetical protein
MKPDNVMNPKGGVRRTTTLDVHEFIVTIPEEETMENC